MMDNYEYLKHSEQCSWCAEKNIDRIELEIEYSKNEKKESFFLNTFIDFTQFLEFTI